MDKYFDVVFLDDAFKFLKGLDKKQYEKILYNIRKSQIKIDNQLFKKLDEMVWELRTLYEGIQYRLLAFWDKSSSGETLVVVTHGFIKKKSKVPDREIQKVKQIRKKYFEEKGSKQ